MLWAAFALSVVFGAIAQRTHFCTMGAVADIVNMGDWTRMRMWAMAIGVAMIGFNAMVALGWVEAANSIYAAPPLIWLSALVGGPLFGFGMVLASGCGSKTLVRIGGGNLKSLVVFFVLGIAAFATLKGITAVARVATVDNVALVMPTGHDLPSLAAATGARQARLACCWVAALGRRWWPGRWRAPKAAADTSAGRPRRRRGDRAMWWVSGRLGHVAEDPNTLQEAFVATNRGAWSR